MKKTKLNNLENNLTYRQRLIFLLNVENSAENIVRASNIDELKELLTFHHSDLILIDFDILQQNEIEYIKNEIKKIPGLRIFASTMFGDDEYIISLIKAGTKGDILRSVTYLEIEKDIHSFLTVENYCMNNQVINIINKSSVNKLQQSNENKRICGKAKKLFAKFKMAIQLTEKILSL